MDLPLPQKTRPSRRAATKASSKIPTSAQRGTDPEQNKPAGAELLTEALMPIDADDQKKYKAWVEIESEPAFFNGVLCELGAQDIKVVEVFSVALEEVQALPYANEVTDDETPDIPKELWFANQTMPNGCATIALLNILMNQPSEHYLGPRLTSFKHTTTDLAPPIRGYLLDTDLTIRRIHNSYARRTEHLNADLLLANEHEDCGGVLDEDPKGPKKSNTKKRGVYGAAATKQRKRRRRLQDEANHYHAFVQVAGNVWVIDGLETNPTCLGPVPEGANAWIQLALDGINEQIARAGDDMLVNILAVCAAPAVGLRAALMTNIATSAKLRASATKTPPPRQEGELSVESTEEALSAYGLNSTMVAEAQPDEKMLRQGATSEAIETLGVEQARCRTEYREEIDQRAREQGQCLGRQRDFTPAMHRWVKALAERGALAALLG